MTSFVINFRMKYRNRFIYKKIIIEHSSINDIIQGFYAIKCRDDYDRLRL